MAEETGTITWQSWDNLISYIKLQLGAPIMKIEFSDNELIQILTEHTMPEFSRYFPLLRYYLFDEENNCIQYSPTKIYQVKNFPYKIIKIDEIIAKPNIMDLNQNTAVAMYSGDVTNLLGANYMNQAKLTVLADDTWTFMAPDRIELIKSNNSMWIYDDFIAKFACIHPDPTTVDPDIYIYLRDLATADIMIFIGKIRKKFRQFATPAGNVEINADEMIQEGIQLKQATLEQLNRMPPDHYLYFLDDN
jgi:hypothetical protein